MRLTLRTGFIVLCATLASACSSLGEDALQDSAGAGRFTAGDDEDPGDSGPYEPGPDASPEDEDEDDSGGSDTDDDRPLEPSRGTTDGGATSDGTGTDGDTSGTDGATAGGDTNATADDGMTGPDGGTTSGASQPNGGEAGSDSGTAGGLPPCEPNVCGTPCDAELVEGTVCAGEGGAVVSCDMGVWSCGP